MSAATSIEWTEATWNPVTGCTKVSEGCDHCYAERLAEGRLRKQYPHGFSDVRVHPDRVNFPLRWRKPRRVFVNSMSDLFHDDIGDAWIADIFAVMAAAPRHSFQVLTKRPGRMASLLAKPRFKQMVRDRAYGKHPYLSWQWPIPNVWLGTSVENQKWADVRIPKLLETPAAVRFLSCEPLLGRIDLTPYLMHQCDCYYATRVGGQHTRQSEYGPRPDWIIVGGESGPGARPMELDWVRQLRDQTQTVGVAFFFKQWGGRTPKAGGRELDGRTWDQYPEARP